MNKKQAQDAMLNSIKLGCSHRNIEQNFVNGAFVDVNYQWFIDCEQDGDYRWDIDIDLITSGQFYDLHRHCASHSVMGQYWEFETEKKMGPTEAVEMIRRSYKRAIASLLWCKKHKHLYSGYSCVHCDDEEFDKNHPSYSALG